ncbi:hypothetical protein LTR54_017323 [Friedmanniomyces endolithicus]|nr:hypothetical protein LTR54_017323 [Friedmanniomyces endolithicus]
MRAFFELELLYSYVYLLSPSPRVPVISPFATTLIFEYCIRYAELILRLISDPSYTAPLSFYDAMRVYMTGRQFLDMLQNSTDQLLNGWVPLHPEVKPTSAPPPAIPVVPLPPDDTVQHFNTVRSIDIINRFADCLSRFGIRWGYMSWDQRYQKETAPMLENLNQRLRDLDGMAGGRRPSMWQHNSSTGSLHSSNSGSIVYSSPHSIPTGPAAYRQPSITAYHMGYGEAGQIPQATVPQYQAQQSSFPPSLSIQPYEQQQQFFQQPSGQHFSFGEPPPTQQRPRYTAHSHPNHQFASWGGYSGPSVSNTLDEENAAIRPETLELYPWRQHSSSLHIPSVAIPPSAATQHHPRLQAQPPAVPRRQPSYDNDGLEITSSGTRNPTMRPPPAPQSSLGTWHQATSIPALNLQGNSSLGTLNVRPDRPETRHAHPVIHHPSHMDFGIQPTTTMPPLTGTGPAPPASAPTKARSSMHDFVQELLYAPPAPARLGPRTQQPIHDQARIFRSPRHRHRDNSRPPENSISRFAGDDGYSTTKIWPASR